MQANGGDRPLPNTKPHGRRGEDPRRHHRSTARFRSRSAPTRSSASRARRHRIVYEAQQAAPRRRGHQGRARRRLVDELRLRIFEPEAAAWRRLDHPNIGKIYESGRTEDGRHFFAMEVLVRGPSLAALARRADRNARSDRDRAAGCACSASSATRCTTHISVVIHRDLKPANVIVTYASASGTGSEATPAAMVKILDFGLARMTEEDVKATQITEIGVIKGVALHGSRAGARRFRRDRRPHRRLRAGHHPVRAADRRAAVYDRLGLLLSRWRRSAISRRPGRSLARDGSARSDLATIVATALEGSQPPVRQRRGLRRRHRTILDLTADSGAAREHDVPAEEARGAAETAVRHRRDRNRPAHHGRDRDGRLVRALRGQLARALQAETSARRQATTAERTSEFLVDLFDGANPERTRGETVTAKEVMDEGSRRIADELRDEPLVQASMMHTIGKVYLSLGVYDKAHELLDNAVAVRRQHLPAGSPETAESVHQLARALEEQGKAPEARAAYTEAVNLYEGLGPKGVDGLIDVLGNYGWMLGHAGDFAAANTTLDRAMKLAEAKRPPDEKRILGLLNDQSTVQMDLGKPDVALAILERALALARRVHGDRDFHTANVLTNIGIAQSMAGHLDLAAKNAVEALGIYKAVYGDAHPKVAKELSNVGICRLSRKRAEARPYFEQALVAMTRIRRRTIPWWRRLSQTSGC